MYFLTGRLSSPSFVYLTTKTKLRETGFQELAVLRGFRQAPSLRPPVLLVELPRVQSRHMHPYAGT